MHVCAPAGRLGVGEDVVSRRPLRRLSADELLYRRTHSQCARQSFAAVDCACVQLDVSAMRPTPLVFLHHLLLCL